MPHYEYFYYAAVALCVLPFARRSPAALAVVTVALANKALYEAGAPEPQAYCTAYLAAAGALFLPALMRWRLGLKSAFSGSPVDLFAAILFAPLALTCALQLAHILNDTQAWWTIYWIALTQALSLPFNIDWQAVLMRWRARTKGSGSNGMHRLAHA